MWSCCVVCSLKTCNSPLLLLGLARKTNRIISDFLAFAVVEWCLFTLSCLASGNGVSLRSKGCHVIPIIQFVIDQRHQADKMKEERGKRKEERGKRKEERGKRKEERGKRKEERGKRRGERGKGKEERGKGKGERK